MDLVRQPLPEDRSKGESFLPEERFAQPELLKQPTELPKPPMTMVKPYCPTPTGGAAGSLTTEQCDQNLPGPACPSSKDVEEKGLFVKEVVDPKNTITVFMNRTRLLLLKTSPRRVQIGDEKTAEVTLIDPKTISLRGIKVGNTVLNLWFIDPADKKHEIPIGYLVRVVPDPEQKARLDVKYKELTAKINCMFPDSRVTLSLIGDKLVVQGQAKDIAEAAQILRIARSNAPRTDDKTNPANPNLAIDQGLSSRDRYQYLQNTAGPYVINLMRIPGEQQVMLKVTVAEINRSAARSIGLNFTIANKHGLQVFAQNTGNIAGVGVGGFNAIQGANAVGNGLNNINRTANNLPALIDNGQISLAIDALRSLEYARTLVETNVVSLNGERGRIQTGGEFPVPIITNSVTTTQNFAVGGVQFIPFGTQLNFTPYITDRDRIKLVINAEVSTRDLATGTNIAGSTVAGRSIRNFSNVVELRSGETLAVGGLTQNNLGAQSSRVPFFGDLPIIGRAFGFDQLSAGEQELVFLITPQLVRGLSHPEVPALPGSDLFEPGDLEFYLLGRLESRRSYDYRSTVRTDIHRMMNYHKCEELYIIGPSGHSEHSDAAPVVGN